MEISIIKLVNGETLLAEVAHEDDDYLSIIDPISINMQLRNNTPVMISTIWMPLTKVTNLFHLKQKNIILTSEVDTDMEIYYNKCIDTIRETTTEDASFLLDREEDQLTDAEVNEVINNVFKADGLSGNSANTILH